MDEATADILDLRTSNVNISGAFVHNVHMFIELFLVKIYIIYKCLISQQAQIKQIVKYL